MRCARAAVALVLLTAPAAAQTPDPADAARKAHDVLKANCYRCHGQDGVFEGGMNFVLDPAKLIARKKVVPGKPDESPLLLRVLKGTMPPPDVQPRPSDADKLALRKWIEAGAPAVPSTSAPRSTIAAADLNRWMLADLEATDRRARRFVRYFSLAHLYNQGLSDDELQTYRNALSKLINSLSWHPKITVPQPVDAAKTLLRIDLRWYMWDAASWNRLLAEYPYGVLDDSATSRAVMVGTATKLPLLRADWFIATASRAPLYYELLQLPANLSELERQLRVDSAVNIIQERVARLGFNGSGVSKNNRILERHDSIHGAYWRTYDFDAVPQNLVERGTLLPDKRNVFAYPLGPVVPPGSESFQHIAGEAIFSLPNGLHGFFLTNAVGTRQDKGATQIVSDPRRPDRAVEAGVSCMSCHLAGINPKTDQVRDHAAKNPKSFSRTEAEVIRAIYPPEATMKQLMDEDAERYRAAVAKTGAKVTKTEPVSTLTLRYEADMDLETAAAEAGFAPEEFRQKVEGPLSRNLGALRVAGGTVSRQVFVQAFGDVVRDLGLGVLFSANANGGTLPDNTGDLDPLESQAGPVNQAAISADGALAVLASGDRSVRLFDTAAGRDVRRFVGHTASVWCVALSADGRRALSGSMDGTVRLWEVATGQEIKRFDGHLTLVSAVAFSSDAKKALSGGYDGSVVLWDLEAGREAKRFDGPAKYVHAVAFAPGDKRAVIAGDTTPRLIDLETGQEVRAFPGHKAEVTCVAFSPDGSRLATGSDDGSIRVWDVESGKSLATLPNQPEAQARAVRALAFAPSGKALASASDRSIRLWDVDGAKQLAKFDKHSDPVEGVTFTAGGKQTLSVGRDAQVRIWPLAKFAALVEAQPAPARPATPTSAAVEAPALKPVAVIPVGGTIGNLALSKNRKWLFFLNRTAGTLVQIEASALKPTRELDLPDSETFALSPDGQTIATFAPDGARTWVILIDAVPLTPRVRFRVDATPYDVAVTDKGLVFLSGTSGGWADVAVIDGNKQSVAGRWGGVWTRSLLGLSPDGSRLYVGTQGVNPGKLEGYPLPSSLDEKPAPRVAAVDAPLGGPFVVSPDGAFLILQTGTVVRLSANAGDDLHDAMKLPPHMAAAMDGDRLFLLLPDGQTVKEYTYPDLKWHATHRLAGLAHQLAYDARSGRLYAAVIDPKSLRDRPRARGAGDVQVYDMKPKVGER